MKLKQGFDPEAIKTLEILSETHRRKAKLLNMRKQYGSQVVREKMEKMQLDQKKLTPKDKQALQIEQDKFAEKMRE